LVKGEQKWGNAEQRRGNAKGREQHTMRRGENTTRMGKMRDVKKRKVGMETDFETR